MSRSARPRSWRPAFIAAAALAATAQTPAAGIVGRDGWLYYQHEFDRNPAQAEASVDLIAKAVRRLEANGTRVLVAMAPIKARIHPEHLPATHPLTPDLAADYDRHLARFRAAGVRVADLNRALLATERRTGEFPAYFRQDTHWSAVGAYVAAEAVRGAVEADTALASVVAAAPAVPQQVVWTTQRFPRSGDLVAQLPVGAPAFEKELNTAFEVKRDAPAPGLLDDTPASPIALLGSSYSAVWTHFPKAVAWALQRDVPAVSVTADRGQWVGLDTYLRDPAFQSARPSLLIWEMPERDLKATPGAAGRPARYSFDNAEWLARIAALAERTCAAAEGISAGGLTDGRLERPQTGEKDTLTLALSRPARPTEYLSAALRTDGSRQLRVELVFATGAPRRYTLEVAGDAESHPLRIPLGYKGKGAVRVKLLPGATRGVTLGEAAICTLPDGLSA